MSRYILDIETNGLLESYTTNATKTKPAVVTPGMDRVHCIVLLDLDNGVLHTFRSDRPRGVEPALKLLTEADEIVGHNVQGFDIPALQLVYPTFAPRGRITDTLVISRLIWTNLKEIDFDQTRKKRYDLPGNLIGRHSLEAWGHRLGYHKGDYSKEMKAKGLDPWAAINDEMVTYGRKFLTYCVA